MINTGFVPVEFYNRGNGSSSGNLERILKDKIAGLNRIVTLIGGARNVIIGILENTAAKLSPVTSITPEGEDLGKITFSYAGPPDLIEDGDDGILIRRNGGFYISRHHQGYKPGKKDIDMYQESCGFVADRNCRDYLERLNNHVRMVVGCNNVFIESNRRTPEGRVLVEVIPTRGRIQDVEFKVGIVAPKLVQDNDSVADFITGPIYFRMYREPR